MVMRLGRALVVALLAISEPLFGQFHADLGDAERIELAEAYYLAGRRFAEIGENARAANMSTLAFAIQPTLDPSAIVERRLPTLEELFARQEVAPLGTAESSMHHLLVTRLLRLASSFLIADVETIISGLDGSVYIAGRVVTRQSARVALSGLFDRVDLSDRTISDLYDLASASVRSFGAAAGTPMSDTFELSVDTRLDLSADVPFWQRRQRFFLRPVDGVWLVAALDPPPVGWAPSELEPDAAAAQRERARAEHERGVVASRAVEETLLDAAGRFLDKDTSGFLLLTATEIELPDGSPITTSALEIVLERYFAATPYRGVRATDVISVASVRRVDRSPDRYRAVVIIDEADSEILPAIRSGQSFDLVRSSGRWVIAAIS